MKKESVSSLLIVLAALAVTIYCLSYIVTAPGSILLSTTGDGAKNYFTFLYHATYGNGVWFTGMNYPYGEHIVFTDGQPVFSVLLGYINQWVHINPLVVMHLLIGAGFFMSIIYVYKILLRFSVPQWWAFVFACLIIIMSPQQLKLTGHFSLAYACVLPMLFYYHLAWLQTRQRKYVWRLFLTAQIIAFVHVYFSMMYVLWMVFYTPAYVVSFRDGLRAKWKHLLPIWLAVTVPMVVLKVFMLLTDTVTDRPQYPYGARDNRTFLNDIYTSYISPVWIWLEKHTQTGALSAGNEGYAYAGIATIIILLIAFIFYWLKVFRQKQINSPSADNKQVGVWLWIAVCMLIFASSIVFRKCYTCLDYAYIIRQFRAVGRFAWPYYYIVTIVSVVILYRWYVQLRAKGRKITAIIIASFLLLVWSFEAIPFAEKTRAFAQTAHKNYNTLHHNDRITWQQYLAQHHFEKEDFQAILVMPYVHIGTEKLGVHAGQSDILAGAFEVALQLHLPVMDVMMSRSSWSQAFAQVKVNGGPFTDKYFNHTEHKKPVLVLHPPGVVLNRDEQHIIDMSQSIGSKQGYDVYALYPEHIHSYEQQYHDTLQAVFNSMTAGDTCINNAGPWAVEHYDAGAAREKLLGTGAEAAIKGNTAIVFNQKITPAYDNQLYECSAWTLVSDKDYKIGRFRVLGFDEKDSLVLNKMILVQESTDNKGLWLRASGYFNIPISCDRIEVELINIINPAYRALDELMIRPADAVILSKTADGTGMVNNHVFR